MCGIVVSAGGPWLSQASHSGVRFVMRSQKGYKLRDQHGENRKAWEITRGKRSWEHRELWDVLLRHFLLCCMNRCFY